jgi:hypothetical protein
VRVLRTSSSDFNQAQVLNDARQMRTRLQVCNTDTPDQIKRLGSRIVIALPQAA